ncbi:MAG: hypothetical protein WC508_02555 [Patescibacteria group bacterium]
MKIVILVTAVILFGLCLIRQRQRGQQAYNTTVVNGPKWQLLGIWVLDGTCYNYYCRVMTKKQWHKGRIYSVRKLFEADIDLHEVDRKEVERIFKNPGNYQGKGGWLDFRFIKPYLLAKNPEGIEALYRIIAERVKQEQPQDEQLPALAQKLANQLADK